MRRHEKEFTGSVFRRLAVAAGLLFAGAACALSQTARPMVVLQTRYEVRVGEPIEIPVAADTLDFMVHGKTRRVTAGGQDVAGLVVAPNETQDKILLAANSRSTPGEYAVTLSATSAAGEEMDADVVVVVKPRQTVPLGSARVPVVLLNGWIAGYTGTCTISSSSSVTFGNLAQYLVADGVPIVYLFDNCVEGANQTIETLGQDLSSFLNSIKYDDGTQVPQIDVVAHSIGGLIARAYLEGLQTNETYVPPYSPLVRDLIMIGVPNFGSFAVGNYAAAFETGTQGAELIPGSALLWNLATWNQRGDDLAGVNAMAIVGNAGSYATLSGSALANASDGFVSTTSASIGFVAGNTEATQTVIVPYCQVDPGVFTNTAALGTFNCSAAGIANVTSTAHETGAIVRSYLAGTTDWKSVGTSPSSDKWLATNGGAYFAMQNVKAGYATDLTSVTWGNAALTDGGNFETIYYTDFVTGGAASDFTATSTSLGTYNCGSLAVQAGAFAAFRCKLNLAIACAPGSKSCSGAVTPVSTAASGRAVTSGTTITLAGEDFGAQCSNCKVYATPAGSTTATALTVTAWSNTAISVQLPSSLTGYQTLQVNAVAGVDSIGVRALAQTTQPALSVSVTALNFAYTVGGAVPSPQSFAISNSGTGTLSWTATAPTSAPWLSLSSTSGTAPSSVAVTVDPSAVPAGTYVGVIQIAAAGATGSPAPVTVTLVVSPAPAVLTVTPASLTFQYTAPGAVPSSQSLAIANSGGGTFTWTATGGAYWVTISAASGALPGTPSVSVIPQNLAPGTYTATLTIAAADNSVTPVSVTVTLTVTGTSPTPAITAVENAASYQTSFASATWVAIGGTNLSQITYTWQAGDIVNGALPTSLEGVSVTIDGIPAYIDYISPKQINVLAPDDTNTGPVQVVVTTAGQASNSFTVQKNAFAPAFLTFNGANYVAATHLDGSLLGPPGLLAGATFTPAAPGETISLYAVGFGPTAPLLPTGQTVTTAEPLANSVTMTIGGVAATVSFAGLSGSGLYQFNVTVPASLPNGDAAVSATVGGANTQTGVLVTVQQ